MNTIVRWNPIREIAAMQSAIDRVLENTWRDVQPLWNSSFLALDIHETDTEYTVVTPLPGLNPDDIHVSIHDGMLTISGEVPQPQVDENTRVLMQERFFGKFTRSVNLPRPVDVDNVQAAYENGILTLTLPIAPDAQPKLITIKHKNGSK